MERLSGAYKAVKKNGEVYYRSSITYHGKHISLGSFQTNEEASIAYQKASNFLLKERMQPMERNELYIIDQYFVEGNFISFDKWVMLLNLKDNKLYCKNPIYLMNRYFFYFIDMVTPLKFDADDLFYYMKHKIMRRGGYLFVADYGMQINILSRYGIKNFAVINRDYRFVNGDIKDYRYGNIEVINKFYGVQKIMIHGRPIYLVKIHVVGDIIVGRYHSETEAAVAYNKAIKILKTKGIDKTYQENYIETINAIEYAKIYNMVRISKRIKNYSKK